MRISYLLLSFAGLSLLASSPIQFTDISKPGIYRLNLRSTKNDSVMCTIEVDKYSPAMLRKRCWGVESEDPQTVIAEIDFAVNGEEFKAPLSSYVDLANANQAWLKKIPHGYRLSLGGADAADAYGATIDFDSANVTCRTVVGGAYTGNASETTKYHAGMTEYGP